VKGKNYHQYPVGTFGCSLYSKQRKKTWKNTYLFASQMTDRFAKVLWDPGNPLPFFEISGKIWSLPLRSMDLFLYTD